MKRTALLTVLCVGFCAWGGHARAAEDFAYQVSDLTLSGGDPTFPVASDVTFTNLQIRETFSDLSFTEIPLSELNASLEVFEDSGAISQNGPQGSVKQATLTGKINLNSLDIETSFGGPINTVSVNDPTFTATLNGPIFVGESAFITIKDVNGNSYNIGTLEAIAVPEPGTVAFTLVSGLSGASLLLRRRRR